MLSGLLESELRSPQMPLPSHFVGQNKSEGQHKFKEWGNRHQLLFEKAVKAYICESFCYSNFAYSISHCMDVP